MAKYYSLVEWDRARRRWFIQFGDYDLDTVKVELRDYMRTSGTRFQDLDIMPSGETRAEIEEALAGLNMPF